MTATAAPRTASDWPRGPLVRAGLGLALALASIAYTKLALPALLLCFLGLVAAPNHERARRWVHVGFGLGAALSLGSTGVFLAREAVPGLVRGGTDVAIQSAVSRLREVLFAEDTLRRQGAIDPDRDGIGSAARLDELNGHELLRRKEPLTPPILEGGFSRRVDTRLGPAAEINGYLFIVCLPRAGGGWTASLDDAVDEELAERRYVAYAWPSAPARGLSDVIFLDEHERILVHPNREGDGLRWIGPLSPPPCDAALGASAGEWQAWRNKAAHRTLPGDH